MSISRIIHVIFGPARLFCHRLPALTLVVLTTLLLGTIVAPAHAFHFPWDQGHDTTDWNDPDNPGPCEGPNCDPCNSTGSPVYIPTGHLIWTESDIGFSGRPPISVSRTYNSNDPRSGVFGNGWTSGCETMLVPVAAVVTDPATGNSQTVTDYTLRFANGKRYEYLTDRSTLPIPAGAPIISPPGRFDTVVPQTGGTAQLVDESGAISVFDANGKLISSAEPTGQTLSNTYDGSGLLVQIADSNGRTVDFAYNAQGYVSSITDHGGRAWTYTYDADGNLTQVDDPSGGSRLYTYSPYTPAGDGNTYYQLRSVADAAGVTLSSFTYINDRVVAHTAGQNTQSYTYNDSASQVTKSDSAGSSWVYSYNADQVITQIRDPLNNTETLQYNTNGDLISYTDYLGNTWTATYDAMGRKLTTTNALNETQTWSYDAADPRPNSIATPTGLTTQLTYDGQGNLTQMVDASGAASSITWSASGEVVSFSNALNNPIGVTHNSIGLAATVTDGAGRVTAFGYDTVGNLASIQNDAGDQFQFSYDSLNRLTSIDSPSGQRLSYTRDAGGRIATMTDAANNLIQNTWDIHGRIASRTFADGRVQTFGRRSDNLMSQTVAPDGLVTSFQYDAAKNLTQIDAGGEVTNFAYNANYQVVQATNAAGTVTVAYDALGRITSETTNGVAVTYQYDNEGRRTSMTSPAGATAYSYDGRGLITQIAAPEGNYGFAYDALGRRTQVTFPNGVASAWTYNAADQLVGLSYSGAYSASFGLTYSNNGLISTVSGDGPDWNYQYDPDGAVTQSTHGTDTFNYAYDAAGNHTGDGQVVNSANQLVEDTLFDYTYDARGNLLTKSAKDGTSRVEYQWNNYDKLISYQSFPSTNPAAIPDRVILYTYGPLGRLFSRTVDGVRERYVYDGGDRILALDDGGATIETVTYGTTPDEPLSIDNAGGRRFVHAGFNGSVAALTDATSVTDTYSYDPFGVTTAVGSFDNSFRYAGREQDADDLYYYRSRFYDPTIRRYLSEDPAGFVAGEFNLYRYVGNNPVNFADPTGEIWPAVLVVWGAVEIGLAIYDAYDTYNTITDPCTGTWEKVFAGTLFVAGAALPGGGYSKADDVVKAADNYIDDVVDLADEGVIYRVPGSATDSGKPYIGRSDDLGQRTRNARDGRDRTQAEIVDTYPKGDIDAARAAEQRAINENGGVPNLDNKRNEIAPSKWGDFGIDN